MLSLDLALLDDLKHKESALALYYHIELAKRPSVTLQHYEHISTSHEVVTQVRGKI